MSTFWIEVLLFWGGFILGQVVTFVLVALAIMKKDHHV